VIAQLGFVLTATANKTATVYAIVKKDPKLQLDPQECAVLTIGSINFSNNFQYFIESRLSTYLNSADINPETILREFDKVRFPWEI
jgi:hypothetical protein